MYSEIDWSGFSAAGFASAFIIKRLKEENINEIEQFVRRIPDCIEKYLLLHRIELLDGEKNAIINLFLVEIEGFEHFQFTAIERTLIIELADLVGSQTPNEDYSLFKRTASSTRSLNLQQTAIGTLFADDLDRTENGMHLC